LKSLAQLTPHAGVRIFVGQKHLGFTFSAQTLLAALHIASTGNRGHGAEFRACTASDTEFRKRVERSTHPAVLAPSYKAEGLGAEQFRADTHAAATQYAILVPERIPDIPYATAHGNVLDCPGIRSLGHEKFGDVAPKSFDFVRIAPDHHPILYAQGAGCRHF